MKKILAALLASYALTSGQAPPGAAVTLPGPAATSPAATAPAATGPAATGPLATAPLTTAAATTAAATTRAATTAAATTAAATTAAPGTTVRATTTAAPVIITPAPITPAPTTSTPTTATPTTAAPTTATPTVYINPYCPVGSGVGRPSGPGSQDQACITNYGYGSVANDWQGRLRCDVFSCCQCSQVNCGFQGYPCDTIQFGDSGAVGVQSINIQGGNEGFGFAQQNGAELECNGLESCKATTIRGNYMFKVQCAGDFGCEKSKIIVENPAPRMRVQCNGLMACLGTSIEINVGVAPPEGSVCSPTYIPKIIEIESIEFNGQQSAQNAVVTVNNRGCDTVVINKFECMSINSCPGITMNLIGNVQVIECDLQGIQNLNTLPPQLRSCTYAQIGSQPMPPLMPGQNPFTPGLPPPPPQQQPINPINPGLPLPPQQPINPGLPGQQQPLYNNYLPPGYDQQLNCNPVTLCANREINVTPRQNFVLDCNQLGGCNGMTLNINVGNDPQTYMPVTRIDALKFPAPNTGVTININNVQGLYAMPVEVENLRCEETGSCVGLTINAGPGINIWNTNFDCGKPFSCTGCTVNQGAISRPCDYQQPQLPQQQFPGQGFPGPAQPQFPGQAPRV